MEHPGLISPTNTIAQVGNYNLIKTIGKGQFGSVKLAVHSLTGEKVAIKIISKTRLDQKTLRMVYREVSIMKLLNHPNIIRLYEVIETATHLFLVMEYASGGEVMDFIVAHGKLKEKDARRFFRQVVAAIDYCHSAHVNLDQILHVDRDLKAENLLLDEKFHIRLIDFGLSNRWTPGEYLNTFCGSPTYTAPELIKRQKYEGPEVDVWSMGVLLYVLVCGSLPFDGSSFQELFTKIISGEYTVADDVSSECRDLIGRMLVVDPKQRATVDQVRTHRWIQLDDGPVPKAVSISFPMPTSVDDIDLEVIEELEQLGFERELTIRAVLEQSYDDAAATYFLLYSKKKKEEELRSARRHQQHQQFLAGMAKTPTYNPAHQVPPSVPYTGQPARPTHSTQNKQTLQQPNPHTRPRPVQPEGKGNLRHRRHHTLGTPGEFGIDQPQHTSPITQPATTTSPQKYPPTGGYQQTSPYVSPGSSPQPSPPPFNSGPLLPVISEHPSGANGKSTRRRSSPRKAEPTPTHHVVVKDARFPQRPGTPTRSGSREKLDIPGAENGATNGLTPATEALVAALPDQKGGLEERAPSAPAITVTSPPGKSKPSKHKRERSSGSTGSAGSAGSSHTEETEKSASIGGVHRRHRSVDNDNDRKKKAVNSPSPTPTTHALTEPTTPEPSTSHKKAFLKTSKDNKESKSLEKSDSSTSLLSSTDQPDSPPSHHSGKPPVPDEPQKAQALPFINVKKAARPQAKVPTRKAITLRVGKEAKQQERERERLERMVELDDWHTMTLDGTVESAPSADDPSPRDHPGKTAISAGNSPVAGHNNGGAAGTATPISPSSSFIDNFKSKLGGLLQFKKPEPRQARFPLNEQSTSHKAPEVILDQIKAVLTGMNIPFLATSPFCYKCQTPNIGFEVEICRLPFLYLNGIRFRRIYGDAWEYTNSCKKILAMLDLKHENSATDATKDKEKK